MPDEIPALLGLENIKKEHWVINLTNRELPTGFIDSLLPWFYYELDKRTLFEVVKYAHSLYNYIDKSLKSNIINTVTGSDWCDWLIKNNLDDCKRFTKDNDDIFIPRSDKGNSTVVIKRSEYMEKMKTVLCNTNYYSLLPKDSVNTRINKKSTFIKKWCKTGNFKKSFFNPNEHKKNMNITYIPLANGLIETHKPYHPIFENLQFNQKFYKQANRVSMHFCSNLCFADFVLELLETKVLNDVLSGIIFYKWYVDDCFLIIKKDRMDVVHDSFYKLNHNTGAKLKIIIR